MAVGIVVAFGIGALSVPRGGKFGWTGLDSMMMIVFGLLIASFVLRYAFIRATPTEHGLEVRNLIRTEKLEWAQIFGCQFGGGQPWLMLDLDTTEQLAVMAIQRSDGERAMREAQRLAALIQAHSGVDSDN